MKLLFTAILIIVFTTVFREQILRFDSRVYLIVLWLPVILITLQMMIHRKIWATLNKASKNIKIGKYEEAKLILESAIKENKNLRTDLIQYSLALCNSRLGYFEESNEIINRIELSKISNKLKVYSMGLKAVNMFFLSKDYTEIKEILTNINKKHPIKIHLLLETIIERKNKNDFKSNEIFKIYKNSKELKYDFSFKESFYFDTYTKFLEKYLLFIFYNESENIENKENIYKEIQENSFYKLNYEIIEKNRII